ncbi:hypothetical protein H4582DRAFT_1958738 [Lactarius indigo]|nr:hypothetical protein H4582DRAFT_1958738 [Lactarius indigo]
MIPMSPRSDRSGSPGPPSFTFTKPVPSNSNPSSNPRSLLNDSPSSTTSHSPYKALTRVLSGKRREAQAQSKGHGYAITINTLPDDVLLDIFDSCRQDHDPRRFPFTPVWRWYELVHVCRRWRQVVFGSPRRLDLHILCTNGTRVRENLDCWPPFPIAIQYLYLETFTPYDEASLFAVLKHRGRIHHVDLSLMGLQLARVATVMQEPFPALTHLTLRCEDKRPPTLPSGFLGGSAPCLQYMHLTGIPFPALHSFLSSTSGLISFHLGNIPKDSCISPEAVVACLAALPRLKSFYIGSQLATSHADQIRPPPVTRTLLPALTSFKFLGGSGYLEELVSRIHAPQLNQIYIKYLNWYFNFQVAQLFEFIDRSEDPELALIRYTDVNFSDQWVTFKMYPCPESHPDWNHVGAWIYCQGIKQQVSIIAQVFSQPSALLSRVVHLKLSRYGTKAACYDDEWLRLLRQFSTVRTLHVSRVFAGYIGLALETVTGDMVTKVLPVLDLIYLDSEPVSLVENFLAARRLCGRPVTIVETEAEFYEKVKFYGNE